MFLTSETKNTCLQHYKKRRQDNLNDLFRQNNQIDSIVSQSDYRSIIFTREYSYHGDDFPSTWKYIFSKSNNKWEIDGIYEFCEICGGEGENYLKRKCPFCDGTGWDNNLF
jgi:hypothetical protein